MFDIEQTYKVSLDELRKLIKSPKNFEAAIEKTLNLHALTHTGVVSNSEKPTICDTILEGLEDADYSVMPTKKDETIAWHLWHIARIEDLVGNMLIAEQSQIFNDEWMERMNVKIKDTGNAMTDKEILSFSENVHKKELINYRNKVGIQTREILRNLKAADLKRKPQEAYLQRLVSEGGLVNHKKSIWLKDFWGRYTISGLMLLPLTYHHMLHFPDSMAIKAFIKNN